MAEIRSGTPESGFLAELVERRAAHRRRRPGAVFGRGPAFEAVRQGVDRLITDAAARPTRAERLRFPPVLARAQPRGHAAT